MEWTVAGITYEWSPDWFQAWSGWVQALGAIFAIWASYRFARAEADRAHAELAEARNLEIKRREEDRRNLATQAAERIFAAGDICQRASQRAAHAADMTGIDRPEYLRVFPLIANEFATYSGRLSALVLESLHSQPAKALILEAEAQLVGIQSFIVAAGPDLVSATRAEAQRELSTSLRKAGARLGQIGEILDGVAKRKLENHGLNSSERAR